MPPKQARRSGKNTEEVNEPLPSSVSPEDEEYAKYIQKHQLIKDAKLQQQTMRKAKQVSSNYTASVKNLIFETNQELENAYSEFLDEEKQINKEMAKLEKNLKYKLVNHQTDFQGSSKLLSSIIQDKNSKLVKCGNDLQVLVEQERQGSVEIEKALMAKDPTSGRKG